MDYIVILSHEQNGRNEYDHISSNYYNSMSFFEIICLISKDL